MRFTAAHQVEVEQERVKPPASNEITVRTVVSAVSAGTELLVLSGGVPAELELDLPTLSGSFGFPIKYGYASAGRVSAAGADSGFRPGEAVFVHHPHQELFTVPAALAVRLPDSVDFEAAALLANLETAVNVVLDARPPLGSQVAVFGQGTVGLLITAVLKQAGCTVMAIDGVGIRRDLAREMGADHVFTPPEAPAGLESATRGRGPDFVIEASGQPEALAEAIACAPLEGTVVVTSWYGNRPVELDLGSQFHRRRLRLISSQVGGLSPALGPNWDRERRTELAVGLLTRLPLGRLVTHRFRIDEAPLAYDLLTHRAQDAVQVVFVYPTDQHDV